MKVQLIVVRGKPEGKVIPLTGPKFKIGRGETCHLRPNSEQVSREHAEFTIEGDAVIVRDLGSRNGTLVNGKALTTDSCQLKDHDLVQVGPLTFAVSIQAAPVAASKPSGATPSAAPAPGKPKQSLDDVTTDDIDSWLLGENAASTADQPTAVYGGDTITITAFRDAQAAPPAAAPSASPPPETLAKPPSVVSDEEYERQTEQEDEIGEVPLDEDEEEEEEEEEESSEQNLEEEFMDESNPFYAAKKAQKEQAKAASSAAKQPQKDSSDAANEILRKLMERRRANRS
jgi:pSer/pThr/pTyr-binding forkhead associated (FHA) protein